MPSKLLLTDDQSDAVWRTWPIGYAEKFSSGTAFPYMRAPHIDLIGDEIRRAVMGGHDRIIITTAPRHSKSETVSHWTPVWALDLFPHWRIGLASYEATFASEWGWKVRETLSANAVDMNVKIHPNFGARNAWYTTEGGGMFTAGIGGPFTGRGFNIGIIDDPFKNFEDAKSEINRQKVKDWYTSTFYTRLEPGGIIIIIMTRWHMDDLVGYLLEEQANGGEPWHFINLPAIAEFGDILGRKPGEALWPMRYPRERLVGVDGMGGIKRAVGSYMWASLYQQRPAPAEGGLLPRKFWKYWRASPSPSRFDEIIQSWDMSFKDTKSSDWVVGQVWGRIEGDRYLLDQVRDKMSFTTSIEAVRQMTAKWPSAKRKLIEEKANGAAVIDSLSRKVIGLQPVNPKDSKEGRVVSVQPEIESGNVFLPDVSIMPWVKGLVDEAADFPNGANDDQVDALTQALMHFGPSHKASGDRMEDQRLRGRR